MGEKPKDLREKKYLVDQFPSNGKANLQSKDIEDLNSLKKSFEGNSRINIRGGLKRTRINTPKVTPNEVGDQANAMEI